MRHESERGCKRRILHEVAGHFKILKVPRRTSRVKLAPSQKESYIDNNNALVDKVKMSDHAVASTPPRNRRLIDFVSGLAAGVISVIVCNPLDITRTRLNVLVSLSASRPPRHIATIILSILISRMPWKPSGAKRAGKASTQVPSI